MRTIVALLVAVCLVMAPVAALAGKGGQGGKGPSQKAYKTADENAQFKREGEVPEPEDALKLKKRKRVEETKGEDMGKGKMERNEERVRKEGKPSD